MKITICGSCDFVGHMKEAADHLTKEGNKCYLPEPLVTESDYIEENGLETFLKMKPVFYKRHFKKIKESDAILVINHKKKGIEGYIGSNTLMEIAIAFYLGKKIFLLNSINENHPHYEELIGLESVILNGDLNKIK